MSDRGKNAVFLIIDALRYDVAANPDAFRLLMPNLAALAEAGLLRRVVANAQSTQFVLPSLFTLSYPLDHGGYNNGIRDRPKSFVEVLRENGFKTALYATANQIGLGNGYQRGFDIIGTSSDYRTQLEHKIARTLSYDIGRWKRGEISEAELISTVRQDFGELLDRLVESLEKHDRSIWPLRLARTNDRVGRGCRAERALLNSNPAAVLHKLQHIAPGVYWRFLGQEKVGRFELFRARAAEAINWRMRELVGKQNWFPFLPLQYHQVIFGDIVDRLCRVVEGFGADRWFIHMHMMDVHDCRSMNRPLHLLYRLKYLPRWLRARAEGGIRRRYIYDSAAMYVDECLGRFLAFMRQTGRMQNTVFLAVADHAYQYAESPRSKTPVGERMHYEDIEVPLVMYAAAGLPDAKPEGTLDSRAVSAGFLQALDIPLHASFSAASVFNGGSRAAISESCGSGAVDLARRDIFFAVTGTRYKIFAVLSGSVLRITQLYDLAADPREMANRITDMQIRPEAEALADFLLEERRALFALRGIASRDGVQYGRL